MAKTIEQNILRKAEMLEKQLNEMAENLHSARITIAKTIAQLKGPAPDYPGLGSPYTSDLVTMANRANCTNVGFHALLLQLIDDKNLT